MGHVEAFLAPGDLIVWLRALPSLDSEATASWLENSVVHTLGSRLVAATAHRNAQLASVIASADHTLLALFDDLHFQHLVELLVKTSNIRLLVNLLTELWVCAGHLFFSFCVSCLSSSFVSSATRGSASTSS